MNGQNMLDRTRIHLQELTKNFFSESEIVDSLNTHLLYEAGNLANSSYDGYWTEQFWTTDAEYTELDLPDGINWGGIPKCSEVGVDAIYYGSNTTPMTLGHPRYLKSSGNSRPTAWLIRGKKILFNGTIPSGKELTIQYYYEPDKIDVNALTTEVDFPDALCPYICVKAAIDLMAGDEGNLGPLITILQLQTERYNTFLRPRSKTTAPLIRRRYGRW